MNLPNEAEEKLQVLTDMLEEAIKEKTVLYSTHLLFKDMLSVIEAPKRKQEDKTAIYVDYILLDQGANISWFLHSAQKSYSGSTFVPSEDSDEASLDSIYTVLTTTILDYNNAIRFHLPNRKMVKFLNQEIQCTKESTIRKRDSVLNLIKDMNLEDKVSFCWRPSNSTRGMKKARQKLLEK